ncbi:1-phosphofructokinase [Planococcus lenghuensis]|uniref:Tagatose-6-phosphate kinase n=1 Tax=Planococcus lenghuensis TaxID=2213202 RepID=A0A1Q2KYZ7_9BACL|nr:1-phosphofructokinase [Planococcus lenghuensis]AQQ53428.1 1-phosphofructokinase [Planococcus lenghuensis]
MIYTCTFSPSIDYTTYLPVFSPGGLNRTEDVRYYPGGKGINVSRVLKRLGTDTVALGFTGGFTGQYIEQFLKQEGIRTDFIPVDGITRINVKIKAEAETELNGPAPELNAAQLKALADKLAHFSRGDWFVLAGSLPKQVPDGYFQQLAGMCRERGIHFVLDTSGPLLRELAAYQPFLIKPNAEELGELFGADITSQAAAVRYARRLVELGIRHVVVSLGGKGAIYVSKDIAAVAEVPKGKVINTVGAGDSLVSGFIAAWEAGAEPLEAFRNGVASGSATAFQSDLCRKQDVEALREQVTIKPFQEQDVNL